MHLSGKAGLRDANAAVCVRVPEVLTEQSINETLGVAGSGAIACGLAAVAARSGPVVLWARSDGSAAKAQAKISRLIERCGWGGEQNVEITTDLERVAAGSYVVEAIVEERDAKIALLAEMRRHAREDAILASTTSSLSIEALAGASAQPERFVGLHVFNPVTKMDLIELVFPAAADKRTRERSYALCKSLGKTAVEVPDLPGFVVNRLLFPFLFEAVRLREETGLEPAAVDACLELGAGHPMGPLALLDLVGLDVAKSIGDTIGVDVPDAIGALVAEGALGRKSGRGFYTYLRAETRAPGSGE
jgi:3-hydroxybutyryl-CoA dehydrogenase